MSFNWFETIGLTLDLSFVKTDDVLINSRNCPPMVGSVLRTPISAKYCWFGWWLGAWSTPSHDPTQLCDIYISGYKYTLISEWTRLFGLLRILDNLISGAVCYFCTTISVFCEIYTLRMRVVAHAAIVWVGWFFMPSSGVGLVSVPIRVNASGLTEEVYQIDTHQCILCNFWEKRLVDPLHKGAVMRIIHVFFVIIPRKLLKKKQQSGCRWFGTS